MAVAETILTSEFFYQLASQYDADEPVRAFMLEFNEEFHKHVVVNYKGLRFISDIYPEQTIANAVYAYALLGEALRRVFNALTADYNPLENYFTDRTMGTVVDSTDAKTGTKSLERTGTDETTFEGDKTREFTNYGSEDASTTFENPGTIESPNYSPVSKTKQTGTIKDAYNSYGSTTEHNTTDATEYDVTNKHDSTEDVTENRSGNSGIFSKQDLTTRELTLRQGNLFLKTAVRMLVDAFNTGVWE